MDGFLVFCIYNNGNDKKEINSLLKKGRNVLLVLDIKGALSINKMRANSVSIFILPESMKQLEQRFKKRQDKNQQMIKKRLLIAKWELKQAPKCGYWVINRENKADLAAQQVLDIIQQNN